MNRASKLLIGLNLILAITLSAVLIYVGSGVHEALTNGVQSLEKHPEYVCVNPGNVAAMEESVNNSETFTIQKIINGESFADGLYLDKNDTDYYNLEVGSKVSITFEAEAIGEIEKICSNGKVLAEDYSCAVEK